MFLFPFFCGNFRYVRADTVSPLILCDALFRTAIRPPLKTAARRTRLFFFKMDCITPFTACTV
jgi:hypothetical protein